MIQYRHPGDRIVLREIWRGRIWSGRPYTVVEDTPGRLVIYSSGGVRWMKPVRMDGGAVGDASFIGRYRRTDGRSKTCASSLRVPTTVCCSCGRRGLKSSSSGTSI